METELAIVRPARPRDACALQDVHELAWRRTYEGILPFSDLQRNITRRNVRFWASLAALSGRLYVLEYEKRVVGYMTLGRCAGSSRRCLHRNGRIGEVFSLYLLPLYQGLGFGSRLLRFAASRFSHCNYNGFHIRALEDNYGACRFYESHGGRLAFRHVEIFSGQEFTLLSYYWPLKSP